MTFICLPKEELGKYSEVELDGKKYLVLKNERETDDPFKSPVELSRVYIKIREDDFDNLLVVPVYNCVKIRDITDKIMQKDWVITCTDLAGNEISS